MATRQGWSSSQGSMTDLHSNYKKKLNRSQSVRRGEKQQLLGLFVVKRSFVLACAVSAPAPRGWAFTTSSRRGSPRIKASVFSLHLAAVPRPGGMCCSLGPSFSWLRDRPNMSVASRWLCAMISAMQGSRMLATDVSLHQLRHFSSVEF